MKGVVLARPIVEILGDPTALRQALRDADSALRSAGERMQEAGRAISVAVSLPIVAIGAAALKTAIDFESSFAGIRKTMNLTEAGFQKLAQANRNLAKEVPVAVNELNRIGELGGQLGIRGVKNMVVFEKTIAQLAVTTDLTAESAALSFAQIANIVQLPQKDIGKLGAAIVGLGNNFATVESKIVDFTQRIAGAGKIAGLTVGDITGISAGMASLGIEAEAGGTAVQKVLLAMVSAVSLGGSELDIFAKTVGKTGAEFQKAFKADSGKTFLDFVEALGRQGEGALVTLDALELKDQRLIRSFLAAAGAGDLLRRSMALGNVEFTKGTALTDEANKRFATTASQLTIMWNRIKDVSLTLGQQLVPMLQFVVNNALLPMIDVLGVLVTAFAAAPRGLQVMVVGFVGLVAAIGPALIVMGAVVKLLPVLGAGFFVASGAVKTFLAVMTAQRAVGALFAGSVGTVVKSLAGLRMMLIERVVPGAIATGSTFKGLSLSTILLANAQLTLVRGFALAKVAFLSVLAPLALVTAAGVFFAKNWDVLQYQFVLAWAAIKDAVFSGVGFVLKMLAKFTSFIPGVGKFVETLRKEFDELGQKSLVKSNNQIMEAEKRMAGWGHKIAEVAEVVDTTIPKIETLGTTVTALGGGANDDVKDALDEFGKALKSIALQSQLFGDSFDATQEKASAYKRVIEDLTAAGVDLDKKIGPQGETLRQLAATYKQLTTEMTEAEKKTLALKLATEAWQDTLEEGRRITESLRTPQEAFRATVENLTRLFLQGAISGQTWTRGIQEAGEAFKKLTTTVATKMPTLKEALKSTALAGLDAFAAFAVGAGQSIHEMVERALRELGALIIKMAIVKGLSVLTGGASDVFLGLVAAKPKALGGPVSQGHPYLVGERGPELFVPSATGRIIANNAMGGGAASLNLGSLPPYPRTLSPEGVALDDWWRRAFSSLSEDHQYRGGRSRG